MGLQIGQIGESYHADGKGFFTERTGMITDKHIYPDGTILYGLMYADGAMTWTGLLYIKNVRWPE